MLDDLQPGDPQLIGPYRLRGVLGTGAMGRVFLGASAEEWPVAVKVVHAGLAADPAFRARFRREIEVARKVSGPFTAPLVDADVDGPVPWLATAYVAGPSLADMVAEGGPMPPGAVLELAAGLAEGLSAVHAAGVVHRDLKPSNIMLAEDGPRLIDFGISSAPGVTALTSTGQMIGSPGFMSPEQAEGLPVGPSTDIFSLGAVLTFAATGEGPFGPGSTVALIYRVIHRPPDLDHVPMQVRGLVERCLVKDPSLRPTARDLRAATRAALAAQMLVAPDLPAAEEVPRWLAQDRPQQRERRPSWRRHWRPLAAAAVIAALAGAVASLGLTAAHHRPPAVQPQAAGVRAPSPATSLSSSADPPRPAATRKAASAVHSPDGATPASARLAESTPLAGSTPLADSTSLAGSTPLAGTAAATSASPPAVSSTRPSQSASPTPRPYPSASASPSPSATLASGGY